jgi:hypothetical protein
VAGERVVSTDALTGVQALERKHPGLPLAPGKVERHAFESIRHGTYAFIISRAVVTGQIVAPACGQTRTEGDVLAHIQTLLATDPTATRWHVVVDNLDMHRSASLVRVVAAESGLERNLGMQGKDGLLANRQSRAAFLSDPRHRMVLHYTPKHAAWRNQIAIWCGMLVLLERHRPLRLLTISFTTAATDGQEVHPLEGSCQETIRLYSVGGKVDKGTV